MWCRWIGVTWKTSKSWLVVSTPQKNISQLGWLFPIYAKIKNVPNHQPESLWNYSRWIAVGKLVSTSASQPWSVPVGKLSDGKTHGFIKQTHFPKQSMEQTSGDLSNSPARSHPRVGTWPGRSPLEKIAVKMNDISNVHTGCHQHFP